MGQVDDSHVAARERAAQVVRLGRLAPVEPHVDELCVERLHHAGPALAEIPGGEDELAVARRGQVGDRGLERARSGRGEHEHVVLRSVDVAQPREAALVDLAVVARTMVDDRLGQRRQHLRRHRRRPRREQVALPGHAL